MEEILDEQTILKCENCIWYSSAKNYKDCIDMNNYEETIEL